MVTEIEIMETEITGTMELMEAMEIMGLMKRF